MPVDESFKKPGSVPFKWEIRPGVPKVQPIQQHQEPSSDHHRSLLQQQKQHKQQKQPLSDLNRSFPNTPQKLKPPPAGFSFQSHVEPRTRAFHSSPRMWSERYRFETRDRPEFVSQSGCFPSPFQRRRKDKNKFFNKFRSGPVSEPDYYSDLEISSRWSMSTRKSLSPFRESPLSSTFPLSSSFFS